MATRNDGHGGNGDNGGHEGAASGIVANRSSRIGDDGVPYEEITLVNTLARKVRPCGPSLDDIERKAAEKLRTLSLSYEAALKAQTARLRHLLPDLANPAKADDAMREMRRIGHDIKGQAATFGFPRVGDIAHLLNDFLKSPPRDERLAAVARAHVDTRVLLIRENIHDREDPRGKQLHAELAELRDKIGMES